jgi:predicted RND superfamily exporter protein
VIAALLAMSMKSARSAGLVLVNLPLAVIGGIAATFVAESPDVIANLSALVGVGGMYRAPVLSVASLVGFITLFGIAVRNGILLVNHFRTLIVEEGASPEEAVRRGSEERLIPILMTAISAALGLAPLALRAGQPGSELLAPLAIVVLGGLVTSTALNLVVVPAGYLLIGAYRDAHAETAELRFDDEIAAASPARTTFESRPALPASSEGAARTVPAAVSQEDAHMSEGNADEEVTQPDAASDGDGGGDVGDGVRQ